MENYNKPITFQEFTEKALRTESKVDSLNVDIDFLLDVLSMHIMSGTILDYLKKGMFYGKYDKLDNSKHELLDSIIEHAKSLKKYKEDRKNVIDYNNRLIHGLLGFATEASEVAEHLKMYLEDSAIDAIGIGEEMGGDADWYKAITFDTLGLSEDECRNKVIKKLMVRYPDLFSQELAENRKLDEERKVLEGKA